MRKSGLSTQEIRELYARKPVKKRTLDNCVIIANYLMENPPRPGVVLQKTYIARKCGLTEAQVSRAIAHMRSCDWVDNPILKSTVPYLGYGSRGSLVYVNSSKRAELILRGTRTMLRSVARLVTRLESQVNLFAELSNDKGAVREAEFLSHDLKHIQERLHMMLGNTSK